MGASEEPKVGIGSHMQDDILNEESGSGGSGMEVRVVHEGLFFLHPHVFLPAPP